MGQQIGKENLMKKFLAALAFLIFFGACQDRQPFYIYKDGDLIFQSSLSGQGQAIQIATRSHYSHMGIVYFNNGNIMVFEAVGPVKSTPLAEWVSRGDGGKYVVKRLKNRDMVLTPQVLRKMMAIGESSQGKAYDTTFNWSDDRMYCSELVWKMFKRGAGIEIGALRKLEDFDLTHPIVRQKLADRYGNAIPLEEPVISPGDMFESDKLFVVDSNNG